MTNLLDSAIVRKALVAGIAIVPTIGRDGVMCWTLVKENGRMQWAYTPREVEELLDDVLNGGEFRARDEKADAEHEAEFTGEYPP